MILTRVLVAVVCLCIVAPAQATLMSRLGGQAAYDDVLHITWVTDAGLSGSSTWDNQVAWVNSLNTANYLGFNDWRLASMSVSAGLPTGATPSVAECTIASELQCRDNELAYMFYYNLGGSFGNDLSGDQTVGGVTLTDIQPQYWSGTEYSPAPDRAFLFQFGDGDRSIAQKDRNNYGWAVRSGDVAVPEPATVVIMGAGLAGLLGFGRIKRRCCQGQLVPSSCRR